MLAVGPYLGNTAGAVLFTLGSGGRTECEVCSEIGFKPNSGNTGAKLGTKDAKEVEFHQPGNVGKQKH